MLCRWQTLLDVQEKQKVYQLVRITDTMCMCVCKNNRHYMYVCPYMTDTMCMYVCI